MAQASYVVMAQRWAANTLSNNCLSTSKGSEVYMSFKLFDVSLCTQGFCLVCGGTGKLKAKRKAKQFNGPDIDYDVVNMKCPVCNGTGTSGSNSTAPRGHRTK